LSVDKAISQESSNNHNYEKDDPDGPGERSGGLVRSVVDSSGNVQVYEGEEEAGPVGVKVADESPAIYVSHDMLYGDKGVFSIGGVVYGKQYSRHNLAY
jgi:hypothetical protein